MNAERLFFTGLLLTAGFMTALLFWLRNPLLIALAELCESKERARFWTRFSLLVLFLVPFALALGEHPVQNAWPAAMYEVNSQIESAIIGFSVSLAILGWMLTRVNGLLKARERTER